MIARIPPGVLRRRAGILASVLLTVGLFFASGTVGVRAATGDAPLENPTYWIELTNNDMAVVSAAPSVDMAFKNRNAPRYPIEAVHKHEQGDVLLDITVDDAGNVTKVAIDPTMTTAPLILQSAAIAAAAHWKFEPGMKDGHPVGGVVQVPVNFSLNPDHSQRQPPCPIGFAYRQGKGKSFSCIARSPTPASI